MNRNRKLIGRVNKQTQYEAVSTATNTDQADMAHVLARKPPGNLVPRAKPKLQSTPTLQPPKVLGRNSELPKRNLKLLRTGQSGESQKAGMHTVYARVLYHRVPCT